MIFYNSSHSRWIFGKRDRPGAAIGAGLLVAAISICCSTVGLANSAAAVAPSSPQLLYPATPAAPAIKSRDQLQVEAALGRDLSRQYHRFTAMFPSAEYTFAEYLHDEYSGRRRRGIMLAGVTAPILASLTVFGSVSLYLHAKEDGYGYCNELHYPDEQNFCDREDTGEIVGIVLISSFGGIATTAVFVPGIVNIARYNKRVRRLSPLVRRSRAGLPRVSFAYTLTPRSLLLGFRF